MIGHKDFPSRSGGVEVVVYELSTALARKGYEVTVYNRGRQKGKNHYVCQGVEVYRAATFQRESLNALVYSVTATFQALFWHYDLIHYHALGPSVMIAAARLFGVKTVATVHGLDWQRAKWNRLASAYLKLGEWVIARCAGEVIVLSKGVQDYFLQNYGRETHLIENAVTPVQYAPCEEIRARYGLEAGEYVLFLARIVPEKGLHYLIEAFKRCATEKKLVVAGELPDNEYGRSIQALAAGQDNILFTGFVQGRVLRELYSSCALYVLPSEIEGLAVSLLEAMSAGARCLTSDIPENTDVLRDFGAVFQSGDAQSLYEALSRLLEEPWENPRAEEQQTYICTRYSYDTMIKKTEEIYRAAQQAPRRTNRGSNGKRRRLPYD